MKKKTIFKIVLMFIVLASILLIHHKLNATITGPDVNGRYTFNFNDVRDSMQIFCIQKNNWLPTTGPDGGPLEYKKFGNPIILNKYSDTMAKRAWAYLLASAQDKADQYDTTKWNSLADNPIQEKIWSAIGENNHNFINQIQSNGLDISFWRDSSESLLKEAYAFANYTDKNLQIASIKINTNDATWSGKIIGPYTIEDEEGKKCDYLIVDEKIIAGVTEFNVDLSSDPNFKFLIYYIDNNKKEYLNNYDEDKKEYLYNSIDLVKFNKNMSKGFYLELEDYPTIPSVNFNIEYKTLNPVAEIQLLKSDMRDETIETTKRVWCDLHSDDSTIRTYGGMVYISSSSYGVNEGGINGGYKYKSNPINNYFLGNDGNIYCVSSSESKSFQTRRCMYCKGAVGTLDEIADQYNFPCTESPNGHHVYEVIGNEPRWKVTQRTIYKICSNKAELYYYNQKDGMHYNNKINCGTEVKSSINYHYTQDLAIINSELNTDTISGSAEIPLTPMFREISLYKTNILNGNLVKNAKFSGYIDNIKSFYFDPERTVGPINTDNNRYTFNDIELENGVFKIYYAELADMNEPVVIKLTETKVPDGYVGMDGEVTITLNYLDKTATITHGSEVTIEDITVDENKLQQYKVEITAKNDPKPEARIQLAKVDSDNNYAPIQGVKFNGVIENAIKPFTAEKMQEFSLTTDGNGIITTDEFMIDDITKKSVVITLTEVEIPEQEGFRYKWLDPNGITIKLRYVEKDDGTGKLVLDNWTYGGEEAVSVDPKNINIYSDTDSKIISLYLTVPNERVIDITGQVWLDGDTQINNKTTGEENGIMDSEYENGMDNILVYLYNSADEVVRTTVTKNGGKYEFIDVDYDPNGYYVVFEYDGVNYINTVSYIEFERSHFVEWYNDLGTNNFSGLYEWYNNPRGTLEQFITKKYGNLYEGPYLLNDWINFIKSKDTDNNWESFINSEATGIFSMAKEDKETRTNFNNKFLTITGGEYFSAEDSYIEFERLYFVEWYNKFGKIYNKIYSFYEWYNNPTTTLEQYIISKQLGQNLNTEQGGQTSNIEKSVLNSWATFIKSKDTDNNWESFINLEETENYYITKGTAIGVDNTKTPLTYTTKYSGVAGWTSTLKTTGNRNVNGINYSNVVKTDFAMDAISEKVTENSEINFGLVKRGIDLALRTDCLEAKVTINGKEQTYSYGKDVTVEEGKETFDVVNPVYNLKLFESDYNYRIRDYVNDEQMQYYNHNSGTVGQTTGEELKVYVTYKLDLNNRSIDTGYIERVKYTYDPRYKFMSELTYKANLENATNENSAYYNSANEDVLNSYKLSEIGNVITIEFFNNKASEDEFKELKLGKGESKTLYLVFEANINNLDKSFTNTAEIITYRTDEGLIDIDSAPGNYDANVNNNNRIKEDDSDRAGAFKITVNTNEYRTITGQVYDNDTKKPVNGVIVQLIELKQLEDVNGNKQYYEYIWQETVSGYTGGKKMKLQPDSEGHWLEDAGLTKGEDGKFAFNGYIPGDYIIRYIYGEKSYTYKVSQNEESQITLYDNIHNGQDYKSTIDKAYKEKVYSKNNYTEGDSVARDNEARRLETIAYAVKVDAEKGLLLKLLDNVTVDDLNEVEIKTLAGIEPKTTIEDARSLKAEEKDQLTIKIDTLKSTVLQNTWMCAETSTVVVEIDSDQKKSYENMNFGLEKRPETKISLDKKITSFKLTASNGQTIIDAYWDDDKNEIAGLSDGLQPVPGTSWKYSVSPLELNTIIDGAKLEFSYDIVVTNEGDTYLGSALANAYNYNALTGYTDALIDGREDIISNVKANGYNSTIGKYLSKEYYNSADVEGYEKQPAKVQVTSIYDYINNDLDIVEGTELKQLEGTVDHYKLADTHSLQKITINQVLNSSEKPTEKLAKNETGKYKVILGRNPISSTGTLDFTNYVAEVMSYTNAAGRRAVATPANAWAVDERPLKDDGKERIVEIDECSADKIQLGESYGEDKETSFIWLAIGVTAVAIIGAGAFVTKKYIIK